MSMAQYGSLLILSHGERDELTRWAQSRTLPAGDVFRARLILALADGRSYREIEKRLPTSPPTIARWRQRFEQHRIEGLNPRHKGSRPRLVTPAVHAPILPPTLSPPPDPTPHPGGPRQREQRMGPAGNWQRRGESENRRCRGFGPRRNGSRPDWIATWPATIRSLRARPPTSLGSI